MLTHAPWHAVPHLRHGFLDRSEHAAPDWRAMLGGPVALIVPHQVHGTCVLAARPGMSRPEADGLVTTPGRPAVAIQTADCMPVLLVARHQSVAAAVHAGWRGAAAGILEAALARLRDAFAVVPTDVEAAIGPSVGPCCYQVGDDVLAAFRARTGEITRAAWRPDGDRWRLDLRHAARLLLAAAGVAAATDVGPCTACDRGWASYRRDGAGAGRQLSFVAWR